MRAGLFLEQRDLHAPEGGVHTIVVHNVQLYVTAIVHNIVIALTCTTSNAVVDNHQGIFLLPVFAGALEQRLADWKCMAR